MSKKLPYIQFYPGDWLIKDPALTLCSPETRGIWIDFICAMHELDRCGVIAGTHEQLARIGRCSIPQIEHAINELSTTQAADVTDRHEIVTVICRRMKNEYNERESNRLRKFKQRSISGVTEKSHPHARASSSSSSSEEEEEEEEKEKLTQKEKILTEEELEYWKSWLVVWEYAHGKGKPMHPSVKDAQLRFLLTIPSELRLDAIKAAHKGQWKNINDPRTKPAGIQQSKNSQLSSSFTQGNFSHEERGVAV